MLAADVRPAEGFALLLGEGAEGGEVDMTPRPKHGPGHVARNCYVAVEQRVTQTVTRQRCNPSCHLSGRRL